MNSTTHHFQTISHFLLYKHHLTSLFASLTTHQIEFLVFKGWSFIPDLYPDPATRPFTDVDILIHPQDYPAVTTLLTNLGYTVRAGSKPAPLRSNLAPLNSKPAHPPIPLEITYSHPLGIHIDLHTHILQLAWWHPAFPIELEEVWHNAQPYQDSTILQLKRFSPEITFLHLCWHLFNHGTFNTEHHSYTDIGKLIDKFSAELNWDYIVQKSKEWGMQNLVYWVAKTLDEEFNFTLPVTIHSKANKNSLQYHLIKSYFLKRHQSPSTTTWRSAFLLRLTLIDDLSKLPKLLLSALIPPPSLRAVIHNHPSSLLEHWRRYTHRLLRQ